MACYLGKKVWRFKLMSQGLSGGGGSITISMGTAFPIRLCHWSVGSKCFIKIKIMFLG